jgi:acetolactate synthase-1/2/3 large subunit
MVYQPATRGSSARKTPEHPLADQHLFSLGVRYTNRQPEGATMGLNVAETVVRMLVDAGVRRGYTVPGESFLDLLDAFQAEPTTTLVSTRHESGAAFMAEADGKLHGVPAVAMASRGPGAANLSIGVHTAFQDQTPMVVLLGQVPSTSLGRNSFQEVDLAAFYRPLAKWSAQANSADEVPALVGEALTSARTHPCGPAVLSVPSDFWSADVDTPSSTRQSPVVPGKSAEDWAPAEIARMLDQAQSPVVVTGCRDRAARSELVVAAEELGLAVYNAFRRQDAFPEDHPHYAGHLGLGVPADQLKALENADLLLVVGTRWDEVTAQGYRYPLEGTTTVHVQTPDADFLRELRTTAVARTRDWSAANTAVREFMTPPAQEGSQRLHPAEVVRTLRRLMPEDTVVTNDAGNFAGFLHRYWCFTAPYTQLGPCNGAMGYAVPAAVAAKITEPHRTVLAMVGDGGALMTGQELETAVRHGAPLIVAVFQNGLYGTIAWHQAQTHGRLSAVSIGAVDFASWARGLGAAGFTVESAQELDDAVSAALAENRPSVLDIRTDPDIITADSRLSTFLS